MATRPTDSPGDDHRPREEPRRPSFWAELPLLLITALSAAVIIKTFLIQPFYIPSGSMVPTIEINDRVMVNKLAYRFSEPQRGEVVVFFNPNLPDRQESFPEAVLRSVAEAVGIRTRGADDLIKRIVAVGGDEVGARDGSLRINGDPVAEGYLPEDTLIEDFGPVAVPPDEVFVMGDNRDQSADSRLFGTVPTDEIIGEAVLRIWPLDRLGGL